MIPLRDEKMWYKCCCGDWSSVWDPVSEHPSRVNMVKVPCWLWKGVLKQGLLNVCLITSFAIHNLGNVYAERAVFFSKCSKTDPDFRCGAKNCEKLCLLDNCIWTGCDKISPLPRQYLSWTFSVLTKYPKILHITKRNIFQVSLPQSHEKNWQICCHADFTCVCDPLTCPLLKGVLKLGFLDICLITNLAVCHFRNT